MARGQFKRGLDRAEGDSGGNLLGGDDEVADPRARANTIAMPMIPIIELCRYSPGMVPAPGVSVGLTAAAISRTGARGPQERRALDRLAPATIGARGTREPAS